MKRNRIPALGSQLEIEQVKKDKYTKNREHRRREKDGHCANLQSQTLPDRARLLEKWNI